MHLSAFWEKLLTKRRNNNWDQSNLEVAFEFLYLYDLMSNFRNFQYFIKRKIVSVLFEELCTIISAQFFCSNLGYPKLAWFYQKNEWASRKMLYFVNWGNAAPSKFSIISSLFFNLLIFNVENWLWKYDFGTFQLSHITSIYKIQHFPWSLFIFLIKSS